MTTMTDKRVSLRASDASGQHSARVSNVAGDASVGELVHGLLARMRLPQNDSEGRPLTYHARLEREGRHLHASESIGETLQNEDHIVLQPHIQAG
ncbi:MAG: hypothetical protein ACREIV_03995 [Planctomycetaceae bacterium]